MSRETPSLEELSAAVRACTRCGRSETRHLAVPGEWGTGSRVMLLGEAPGKQEDGEGRPFIGRSGRYLERLMAEYGVSRECFFITSVLKCFHPGAPRKSQIRACMPWTELQIQAAGTGAVLVMGATAANALLGIQALGRENAARSRRLEGASLPLCTFPAVRLP